MVGMACVAIIHYVSKGGCCGDSMSVCSVVAVNSRGAKTGQLFTSLPLVSNVYQPISTAGAVNTPWGRGRVASGLKEFCVYMVSWRSYS